MADDADVAQPREDMLLELNIARVRAQIPMGMARSTCADCGNDIPAARQQASPGCQLCVDCQELEERARRRYGRA